MPCLSGSSEACFRPTHEFSDALYILRNNDRIALRVMRRNYKKITGSRTSSASRNSYSSLSQAHRKRKTASHRWESRDFELLRARARAKLQKRRKNKEKNTNVTRKKSNVDPRNDPAKLVFLCENMSVCKVVFKSLALH